MPFDQSFEDLQVEEREKRSKFRSQQHAQKQLRQHCASPQVHPGKDKLGNELLSIEKAAKAESLNSSLKPQYKKIRGLKHGSKLETANWQLPLQQK